MMATNAEAHANRATWLPEIRLLVQRQTQPPQPRLLRVGMGDLSGNLLTGSVV